jgi:DNA-binding XRE family transcriptional regulator
MAKAQLTRNQKQELAQLYYLQGYTVQKDLATKVGVTEKTISKWKIEGRWENLVLNIPMVKQQQIQKLLRELEAINGHIENKAEGKRFADSKEADVRRKLIADIKDLEGEASVSETINVAMAFTKWVSKTDAELSRTMSIYFDLFIKEQAK